MNCTECSKRFSWIRWMYRCTMCACTMCKACSLTFVQPLKSKLRRARKFKVCLSCSSNYKSTSKAVETITVDYEEQKNKNFDVFTPFQALLKQTLHALNAPMGSIQLIGDDSIIVLSSQGYSTSYPIVREQAPCFLAWLQSTRIVKRDILKGPRLHANSWLAQNNIQSYVSIPIYLPNSRNCIGTLDVAFDVVTAVSKPRLDKLVNFATDASQLIHTQLTWVDNLSLSDVFERMQELVQRAEAQGHRIQSTKVQSTKASTADKNPKRRQMRFSEQWI